MKLLRQGKVRDIYEIDDRRLLLVATDRLSAYDSIFPDPFPEKGIILTELTKWWLQQISSIIPHHWLGGEENLVRELSDDDLALVPEELQSTLARRSMLVEKCDVIPYECIVRGYAFGSYLRDNPNTTPMTAFDPPLFTPTTKEESGHDRKIGYEEMVDELGEKQAEFLQQKSLFLYRYGHKICREAGLILVDTKFEFGLDSQDQIRLVDECFTPDSSRYMTAGDYEAKKFHSYDKQVVRDHVDSIGWDHQPPAPKLDSSVIEETLERYQTILDRLTKEDKKVDHDRYQVTIETQDGVLDPEMSTLQRHLQRTGHRGVGRLAKKIVYEIEVDREGGEDAVRHLAEDILANPEIHKWNIEKL